MARLGVDYGTTHTVVVCNDRGHYPVVPQVASTAAGPVVRDVFPSLAVLDKTTREFVFGMDAERLLARPDAEERFAVIRSPKRLIRDYAEGCRVCTDLIPGGFDPADLLDSFAVALRRSILKSGLISEEAPLEAVITWPANANGAQRYLTRRSFRRAGFTVLRAMSEPVAASIEFADRMSGGNRTAARRLTANLAVFDLGGGTFDASLVKIQGHDFSVVGAVGIERLGGDDFDEILARRFAHGLGADFDALSPYRRFSLLREAARQKEGLATGAVRTLTMAAENAGLPGSALCRVPVQSYLAELEVRLAPCIEKLRDLLEGPEARAAGVHGNVDAIYLVGGSSKLPVVQKMLTRHFPQMRVVTTDKPFTSTAMGAAIHSAEEVRLQDVLARTFGVLRLEDRGTRTVFVPIFPAGTKLPQPQDAPLERTVEYSPRHNIGCLRYLECATVNRRGLPEEGVRHWSDVLFPYDPAMPVGRRLSPMEIAHREDLADKWVGETYTCDSDGVISVRIRRHCDGQEGVYEIYKS